MAAAGQVGRSDLDSVRDNFGLLPDPVGDVELEGPVKNLERLPVDLGRSGCQETQVDAHRSFN